MSGIPQNRCFLKLGQTIYNAWDNLRLYLVAINCKIEPKLNSSIMYKKEFTTHCVKSQNFLKFFWPTEWFVNKIFVQQKFFVNKTFWSKSLGPKYVRSKPNMNVICLSLKLKNSISTVQADNASQLVDRLRFRCTTPARN